VAIPPKRRRAKTGKSGALALESEGCLTAKSGFYQQSLSRAPTIKGYPSKKDGTRPLN